MGRRPPWVRPVTAVVVTAALMVAAGCEPLDALNVFESEPAIRDVRFSEDGVLSLDVYAPDTQRGEALPVVVFFYGGAWQQGSKEAFRFVGSQLAQRGVVTVLPDYRVYPAARFPEFVEDAAAAVSWTFDNAAAFGADPTRVFVMGHSAGAHIASMVHYDERYLDGAGAARMPCGFIGLAGPYDFLPLVDPDYQAIFPAPLREDSQPLNFVTGREGPALLVHGLQDDTVKPRNSASLAEAVQRAGGTAELNLLEGRGHVDVLLSLAAPLKFLAPTLDAVTDFVVRQDCRQPQPGGQQARLDG
jgi:acetyl esterase/lipase